MSRVKRQWPCLAGLSLALLLSLAALASCLAAGPALEQVRLPPGFSISVLARVPGARSMALGKGGTLFVGTWKDTVHAVVDADGDHVAEQVLTIAEGLNSPNGVAVAGDDLYVAEIGRVLRFVDIEARLADPPEPDVVNDSFPEDEQHGWKYIAFGPDGLLYVPVGAPCNVCRSGDERFATIMRMRPDGKDLEVFARGIRNTVGFDFHPGTGALWFTNNGRDWMGDELPPDTLNVAPEKGLDFGFPYCHGNVPDPEFGQGRSCQEFADPVLEMPAHTAALGMTFYDGGMFPVEHKGDVFIAEHGSWNRSTPVGYRVTRVRLEGSKIVGYEVFAAGFRPEGEKAWGRPVDVLVAPDGALLVSDDHAGAIYRIAYTSPR
jgi:glucose/arabinose dehydrogenase